MVEELNVGTSGARVRFTEEMGQRRSRKGDSVAEGVFSESTSGYGFVSKGDGSRDIFIPESRRNGAIDTDTVRISYRTYLSDSGEERTEGRVIEIIEYGRKNVIGTVDSEIVRIHKRRIERYFVIADDGRINGRIYLTGSSFAERGDKVIVRLVRGAAYPGSLEGEILDNLGPSCSKEANYAAILAECEIETDFTEDELAAAAKVAAEPISEEGRTIRDEIIFTIDSESAKDLDDAVSIKKLDTGYELGVHIADVSAYVKEKTVLDRLVMARGNSVYFTDKVIPMLPESLSNGACSLSPGTEKYTLSAIITLDSVGAIISTRVEPSIIKSRVKGVYSEINRIFSGDANEALVEKYRDVLTSLYDMRELYLVLAKRSRERGAMELDSPEAEILLGADGSPVDIIRRERGESERLIEQFMLTANEAIATLLREADIPCVYRVHEAPPEDKLCAFIDYAHRLGFDTSYISREKCSSRDLANLLGEASQRGLGEAVSYACLRSMSKASYSDIPRGHYGLAIKNYCHFTSPIRRLSDLATHRIIRSVLLGGASRDKFKAYAKRAAAAATDGEMRAVSAERRIESLYKVLYMKDHVGEEFDATVSSVTSFGAFATLDNTCEGLIPISSFATDYLYDEKNLALRSSSDTINIGDKIRVRLEEADIIKGKLRFTMTGGEDDEG